MQDLVIIIIPIIVALIGGHRAEQSLFFMISSSQYSEALSGQPSLLVRSQILIIIRE